ncbi:MAG: phosphoribosylformylglycinamidine synthase subunit PurL, partial [Euryarchaeota archaeon]|nr:phosphoribosylformylglycinamidine synthase subunit PurL [Euryarchaeota archaeon]
MNILSTSDRRLLNLSRERQLFLNLEEMRAIKEHFARLGRNPTEVELETLAQTWSEHCAHKTFKGTILTEEGKIDNLLKSTIARVTRELSLPWCFSVFEDNAGIVDFEGDVAVAFKVETHNHPSALEPFGGAATGVGGVIRDVLGVWGEPIANTNVLCFGSLDFPYEKLPKGVKHPRFIYSYVTAGIGSYGNNMGIPTVNGAIFFDNSYVGNPVVYCGTVGLVPKSKYVRNAKAGDVILLVGGKTGRDGIHGVTFASAELEKESEEIFGTAVQIGDPIQEEKIKRAVLQIRDKELCSAITDLGGGGLSSAVGETAHGFKLGARVYLEKVPLKYPNMRPWEIWCSESQERMLLAVPRKNLKKAIGIFEDEDVEATPIGEFTADGKLVIKYKAQVAGKLSISFMFDTRSKIQRKAKWIRKEHPEPKFSMPGNLTSKLLKILSSPNVASKESVIRTYDHEVKAMTVLKPLQGICNGPGDAAVMKPLYNSWRGIAISNGINPEYGKIDPYWMAASAVDEAIRNNVAVGGRRIALLDNFVWGNPEKPDRLGSLVRAAKACYEIAKAFGTPFISGKDSLYNESVLGPVTPTLLISALGIIPDVRKAVSMDLKKAGSLIYIIGETRNELGGSHYYKIHSYVGRSVPRVAAEKAKKNMNVLTKAIDLQLVKSCHDLSEGGLAAAGAEMAFAGDVGIEIQLNKVPVSRKMREDAALFSESNSRFLVEVSKKDGEKFEKIVKGNAFAQVGTTTKEKELKIFGSKLL